METTCSQRLACGMEMIVVCFSSMCRRGEVKNQENPPVRTLENVAQVLGYEPKYKNKQFKASESKDLVIS